MGPITVDLARATVVLNASRSGAGSGAERSSATLQGVITAIVAEQLVVTAAGATKTKTTMTLADGAQIIAVRGLFGRRREARSFADLIPGLRVKADGASNGAKFEAVRVTFKASDLNGVRRAAERADDPDVV